MRSKIAYLSLIFGVVLLTSCSTAHRTSSNGYISYYDPADYEARMPQHISTGGERVVVVDPSVHSWGAYEKNGQLVRGGIATAGGNVCEEGTGNCRTGVGTFRVSSLGDGGCFSKKYPLPHGGGLMPYCMFFNNGQALHGSPDGAVVENNISHGCVRLRIPDAEWLRYNFVTTGTKVIVQPY